MSKNAANLDKFVVSYRRAGDMYAVTSLYAARAVSDGVKQSDLANSVNVGRPTVSNYVLSGLTLTVLGYDVQRGRLVGDADVARTVLHIVKGEHGSERRTALREALKDGDADKVRAVVTDWKTRPLNRSDKSDKSDKSGKSGKRSPRENATMSDMSFDALAKTVLTALEMMGTKKDAPKKADVLIAIGDAAHALAESLSGVTVD